jgi:hypothetical protein
VQAALDFLLILGSALLALSIAIFRRDQGAGPPRYWMRRATIAGAGVWVSLFVLMLAA